MKFLYNPLNIHHNDYISPVAAREGQGKEAFPPVEGSPTFPPPPSQKEKIATKPFSAIFFGLCLIRNAIPLRRPKLSGTATDIQKTKKQKQKQKQNKTNTKLKTKTKIKQNKTNKQTKP